MAISREAKAKYDRERYLRLGPRQQNRDKAAKAAYDKARHAALRAAKPRVECARDGCTTLLPENRRGGLRYCSPECRAIVFGLNAPTHPEAREPLPRPYTGHRWLDMAREAAGGDKQLDMGLELYDRYTDEMGEAVLALLEGGDPKAAVVDFRRREYVARYRTTHFSEWAADDEGWKLDRVLAEKAPVESAESVVVGTDAVVRRLRRLPRVHGRYSKGMMGTPRQGTPTNRRQNAA